MDKEVQVGRGEGSTEEGGKHETKRPPSGEVTEHESCIRKVGPRMWCDIILSFSRALRPTAAAAICPLRLHWYSAMSSQHPQISKPQRRISLLPIPGFPRSSARNHTESGPLLRILFPPQNNHPIAWSAVFAGAQSYPGFLPYDFTSALIRSRSSSHAQSPGRLYSPTVMKLQLCRPC